MPTDPAKDQWEERARSEAAPARRAAAVTPHDDNDLSAYAKALYVGVAGDVKLIPTANADDAPVIFKAHPVGYLACQARRVLSTGTTATNILALFD